MVLIRPKHSIDADTIEFQKRGLPHAHILTWLADRSDTPAARFIDTFISAELPDPRDDPLGYQLVQDHTMHGPCGVHNPKSPCMKDGRCSKGYPKPFHAETFTDQEGFPVYRRSDNGLVVRRNGVLLDNRWVVPRNLQVLKKY